MKSPSNERWPRSETEAVAQKSPASDNPTVLRIGRSRDSSRDLTEYIDRTFLVVERRPSGVYKGHCLLTLSSALNAAKRVLGQGGGIEVAVAELVSVFPVQPCGGAA